MQSCFRSRPVLTIPSTAAKYALRSLACRYRQLSDEVRDSGGYEIELCTHPVDRAELWSRPSVWDPDTAATLLIAAGSNPDRLRSEAAFASLCRCKLDTCLIRQNQPSTAQPRELGTCSGTMPHSDRVVLVMAVSRTPGPRSIRTD